MKTSYVISLSVSCLLLISQIASADVVSDKLAAWQAEGAGQPASVQRGQKLWSQVHAAPSGGKSRSCGNCHTDNLSRTGKHVKTGKKIDPLAPSANRERLTDSKKIDKWFKRNCKWTIGRECTAQEKSDLIVFIQSH